jgi:GTP-binding protein
MPTIAIVGRPNVGKSTLFNRLSKTRNALVADEPGVTRDRQYASATFNSKTAQLIDTGGLSGEENIVDNGIRTQVLNALDEADLIYFVVSGRDGLTTLDREIATLIRPFKDKTLLLINKCESGDTTLGFDFFELGLEQQLLISSEHGLGIGQLIDTTEEWLPDNSENTETSFIDDDNIKLAVLGRPNVGKSTLINRMLGEERVLALDMPGTTRDSIEIPFEKDGVQYTLIDTAGIRRKRSVDGSENEKIEKFSIIKAIDAIEKSNVVMLILDASEGITEQDATLLGMSKDKHKPLMIIINKWDGLDEYQKDEVRRKLDVKLSFVNYASVHFISALHGSGVGKLFKHINNTFENANTRFSTSKLNRVLELANRSHSAPPVGGKRLKLKFVNQSSTLPPTFVFHGNNTENVPNAYLRFLQNIFIRELGLKNTPIKLLFKSGENPFKDKKNKLNERQIKKRRRMMKFVKKK